MGDHTCVIWGLGFSVEDLGSKLLKKGCTGGVLWGLLRGMLRV